MRSSNQLLDTGIMFHEKFSLGLQKICLKKNLRLRDTIRKISSFFKYGQKTKLAAENRELNLKNLKN